MDRQDPDAPVQKAHFSYRQATFLLHELLYR